MLFCCGVSFWFGSPTVLPNSHLEPVNIPEAPQDSPLPLMIWNANRTHSSQVMSLASKKKKKKKSLSHVQLFETPWTVVRQAPLSMNSPNKNLGVVSHSLLQGIFLTQGSNQASCSKGGFFTIWATREAQGRLKPLTIEKIAQRENKSHKTKFFFWVYD